MADDELVLNDKPNVCAKFALSILQASPIAQLDGSLQRDVPLLTEGHAIYIPELLCDKDDFGLLKQLMADLEADDTGNNLVAWSKHAKLESPLTLPTFNRIVMALAVHFDLDIYATRLNFYADNTAWKPFHHDSHAYAAGSDGGKEDLTVGVSLGAERELCFKHVQTGQMFAFPQRNGDLFAFDTLVNKVFMHGVPRATERTAEGPRFSIIAWGRRRTLNARNAGLRDVGNRSPPSWPLRVPSAATREELAAHGPSTTEETAEPKRNEVVSSLAEVAQSIAAFVEQQEHKQAEAEAAKAAARAKATERQKAKPRVQGGWSKKK